MFKTLTLTSVLGTSLFLATGVVAPHPSTAQEVTMTEAMLERCEAEGLTGEICACWFAEIAAAEGFDEFTEEDIDELAPYYQEELAACIEANS